MPPIESLPESLSPPAAEKVAPLRPYRHFVIGFLIYMFLCQFGMLFFGVPKSVAGIADLRAFYAAGYMVRSGNAHLLYDLNLQERMQNLLVPQRCVVPFLYPAFASLLFAPLSYLSWRSAYLVFFAINLALLWLAARLLRDSLPHLSALWRPLPLCLFFFFFPAADVLMLGQASILLLVLYCAAFASLQKGNPLRAGIFLGLAMIKFQTALPVALLFLLWRRWRVVAGFLAGVTVELGLSMLVTGYAGFVQYWRSLFHMAASASGVTPQFRTDPAMMANLFGLARLFFAGAWGARLAAAAVLLILIWTATRRPSLPIALIAGVLVSRYLGLYDLVLLLLPISLALDHAVAWPQDPRARSAAVACLILLIPQVYLSLMVRNHLNLLSVALLALLFCLAPLKAPGFAPGTEAPASST